MTTLTQEPQRKSARCASRCGGTTFVPGLNGVCNELHLVAEPLEPHPLYRAGTATQATDISHPARPPGRTSTCPSGRAHGAFNEVAHRCY